MQNISTYKSYQNRLRGAESQAISRAGDTTPFIPQTKIGTTTQVPSTPVTVSQLQVLSDTRGALLHIAIHDLGLENHDLRECVLVNMNLKDCTIINCDLKGCILTSSAKEDNESLDSPPGPTLVWRSTFKSCTIQNSHVYHSQIDSSTIGHTNVEVSQIHDSKIIDSMLSNTSIENSTIEDCHLYNYETILKSDVTNSTVTTAPGLRRLPREIRCQIFAEVFQSTDLVDQNGRPVPPSGDVSINELRGGGLKINREALVDQEGRPTLLNGHVLINALRGGDLVIYREALGVMYKTCAFLLHPNRYQDLENYALQPLLARQSIWHLIVDCYEVQDPIHLLDILYKDVQSPQLRHLQLMHSDSFLVDHMTKNGNDWLRLFEMIRRLTIQVCPVSQPKNFWSHNRDTDDLVTAVNRWFDVPGRLTTVETSSFTTWFWDAGRRGLLNNGTD